MLNSHGNRRGANGVIGIMHPPQAAILGLGRLRERAWMVAGRVVPRPATDVSLAADHRASRHRNRTAGAGQAVIHTDTRTLAPDLLAGTAPEMNRASLASCRPSPGDRDRHSRSRSSPAVHPRRHRTLPGQRCGMGRADQCVVMEPPWRMAGLRRRRLPNAPPGRPRWSPGSCRPGFFPARFRQGQRDRYP